MKKKIMAAVAILLSVVCMSGCGGKAADISSYGDTPITVSGLLDEDFEITPNELAELDCVSRTATGATAKAGTVSVYGPLLDTFLAQYDCKASDFKKIRFLCADEYKTVLKDEYLTDYEVVLAISGKNEPLPEDCQPLRLLIPEAESAMWAYSVVRIEFERDEG
jgi:DMSO/TMAO reductase YedYZ molybdopterin-dependent catalytic subunit